MVKTGYIVIRPVLIAMMCVVVVATAPISVPYIIILCKEKGN
jgi:hypothetical protein